MNYHDVSKLSRGLLKQSIPRSWPVLNAIWPAVSEEMCFKGKKRLKTEMIHWISKIQRITTIQINLVEGYPKYLQTNFESNLTNSLWGDVLQTKNLVKNQNNTQNRYESKNPHDLNRLDRRLLKVTQYWIWMQSSKQCQRRCSQNCQPNQCKMIHRISKKKRIPMVWRNLSEDNLLGICKQNWKQSDERFQRRSLFKKIGPMVLQLTGESKIKLLTEKKEASPMLAML